MDLSNDEIESMSNWMWEKYIKNKIKIAVLKNLTEENSTKEKNLEYHI